MILYHITPKKNIDSILEHGILPNYGNGLTCGKRTHDKVFLTNDVLRIITTQAGELWVKHNEPVIFEIELDESEFKPLEYHSGGTYTLSDFEFTTDKVRPNQISGFHVHNNPTFNG